MIHLSDFWYIYKVQPSPLSNFETFYHHQEKPVLISIHSPSPSPPSPSPRNDGSTFYLYGFACSGHSHKWNYTLCGLLYLAPVFLHLCKHCLRNCIIISFYKTETSYTYHVSSRVPRTGFRMSVQGTFAN